VRQPLSPEDAEAASQTTHRPGSSQVCPFSASSHVPAAGFYQAFTVAAIQKGAA
jgi:hypothetical protein